MKVKCSSLFSRSSWRSFAARLLALLAVAVILWPHGAVGQQPAVPKLTFNQVEQLVSNHVPDSTMRAQIQRRGLAFVPNPAIVESLRTKGAGPQTLSAIEEFFSKPTLSVATSSDLLYMPSFQGLGLMELNVGEGGIRRTAKTALVNNSYVSWNAKQREFYVSAMNGDAVSVISADTFTEIATMKGDVGWNTSSTALSLDGRRFYLACFGGSPQALRLVSFDTASRSHLETLTIPGGGNAAYLALSPNGNRLYVAWGSGLAEYEAPDLKLLREQSFVGWPLIVSSDGRFLFTLQQNRLLRIRIDNFSVDKSLTLPEAAVKLSLSRDGGYVFASGKDEIYRVPLSLDSETVMRPPHGVGSALEFAESSDGRALYVLSGGNQQESVWVIDLTTRQVMKTIDGIAFPFSIIAVPEVQMRQQPDSKRKPFALQPAVPHEPTPLSETDSKQSAPIAELLLKNLPQPTDYVSDFAHVLSPDVVRRLDRICSQLDHTQANAQVAVVTIPTIDGAEVADYAKELGNKWGIGRKGSDRGVLVLLAVNDHKWRINVGYGLESILPDPKTGEIGREMVPLLRANDFDGAIALAVSQVAQVIAANANVTLDDAVAPLQR